MFLQTYRKALYASLFVKKAGMGGFMRHLGLQLYSKGSFVLLAKNLTTPCPRVEPKLTYSLRLVADKDMAEILGEVNKEDPDSAYELLGRRLFYDRGFRNCYLAEASPGGICHLSWQLYSDDNELIRTRYPRLPPIQDGDVMLENSFTFAQFRGKSVFASIAQDLCDMAKARGFRRMICYVDKDNQSSLRSLMKVGFRPSGEAAETKFLFTTKRRYTEGGARDEAVEVSHDEKTTATGAVVIGGTFQALGILRSLSKRHIPVYLVDSQLSVARFSRCKKRFFHSPRVTDSSDFLAFLQGLATKEGIKGWVIYPNDDETAAFLAMFREELGQNYRVPCSGWGVVEQAYDKRLTYRLAEKLGIPIPRTFYPSDRKELEALDLEFPVIVKPAIRVNFYEKTRKKALRANSREELVAQYEKASAVIKPSEAMVQELIPGGPQNLYSFGSFFKNGEAVGKVVARRSRQHPMDFGHATTFAETVDIPEIEELGKRFLRGMDYYGISEVEFMQDPRDGKYKLIEINARPWGWHSLAIAAGADLPYMLFRDALGEKARANGFEKGIKWVRLTTDIPTAWGEILRGRMRVDEYFASLRGKKKEAVFSLIDPWPFVAEIALLPYFWAKRGF